MQSIAVLGCGYVGLVTGVCFAHMGHRVRCYDSDITKVRMLQDGEIPFYEPQLDRMLAKVRAQGRFEITGNVCAALQDAQLAFIAVGTPSGPTGEADLTYVRQAAREIAAHAPDGVIVVNKSTVPVDTADVVERILREQGRARRRVSVASNPEFLREGTAVSDFLHPDRVVIGSSDTRAIARLRSLYEPLGAPIHVVDVHTAEMIKYAANAFLATKISFINEIANLCAVANADVDGVVAGIAADARIGPACLKPGLGFGGSCLPKDVSALATFARSRSIEPTMLDAALSVNRRQITLALRALEERTGDLYGKRVMLAGLAFKGGTADLRESPALVLCEALLTRGARVTVHDAHAAAAAKRVLEHRVRHARSVYDGASHADAFIIANDDRSYAAIDWQRVAGAMEGRDVFDFRNRARAAAVRAAGLTYHGVGRTLHAELVS